MRIFRGLNPITIGSLLAVLLSASGCSSASALETQAGPFCSTGFCQLTVKNNGDVPVDLSGELCGVVGGAHYQNVNGYVSTTVNPGQKAYFEFSVFGALDSEFTGVYLGDCSDKSSKLSWDVRDAVAQTQNAPKASSSTPQPTATAEMIPNCEPGTVSVSPFLEEGAVFYSITYEGSDCSFNVGSRVTFYSVFDGQDIYWSSRDCDRSGDSDLIKVLTSGSFSSTPSAFPFTFSSEEGCGPESNEPLPAGVYYLFVEVNGVMSESPFVFQVN